MAREDGSLFIPDKTPPKRIILQWDLLSIESRGVETLPSNAGKESLVRAFKIPHASSPAAKT